MTNLLSVVPALSAAIVAVTELAHLVAGLALLSLGLQTARQLLDLLVRVCAALTWAAELTLLAIALVLSVFGDIAPALGRCAGRAAGRAVHLGRQARRLYDRHLAPTVISIVAALDRSGRAFVLEQLGSDYPALTAAIAFMPSAAPGAAVRTPQTAVPTSNAVSLKVTTMRLMRRARIRPGSVHQACRATQE